MLVAFYDEPISKYDIISTSIFNMGSKSYKNFAKYLLGVEHWLKLIKKDYKDYPLYLRVHFDDSIKNDKSIMKHLLKLRKMYDRLQLTYYNFKQFENNPLFGTLVRFMPLFDKSPPDYIYLRDVDISPNEKLESKYVNFVKNPISDTLLIDIIGYEPEHLKGMTYKYMIPAVGTRIKLPIKIWSNFIKSLEDPHYTNSNPKQRHINKENPNFYYGIDEYFLNREIIPLIIKDAKIIRQSYPIKYIYKSIMKSLKYNNMMNLIEPFMKSKNKIKFLKEHPEIKRKYLIQLEEYKSELEFNDFLF